MWAGRLGHKRLGSGLGRHWTLRAELSLHKVGAEAAQKSPFGKDAAPVYALLSKPAPRRPRAPLHWGWVHKKPR